MDADVDFGELSSDENLKNKILDFRRDVNKASDMLESLFSLYKYEELSLEDKVRYDLYIAFAINTFYWFYLRAKGIDPNQHEIKSQINRVREYMSKSKKIYERKTIMPRIDQDAAKRFVRSGLWAPENSKSNSIPESTLDEEITKGVKRKRDDTDD